MPSEQAGADAEEFTIGVDYILENGQWVFTDVYHLRRGYCCHNGCRFCPYDDKASAALPNSKRSETCDNCGLSFECRPGRCWCDELTVTPRALAEIRARFDRCLCAKCLTAFAKDFA